MADYKQMYLTLLDATEKAINELISAQRACEELYVMPADDEDPENEKEQKYGYDTPLRTRLTVAAIFCQTLSSARRPLQGQPNIFTKFSMSLII